MHTKNPQPPVSTLMRSVRDKAWIWLAAAGIIACGLWFLTGRSSSKERAGEIDYSFGKDGKVFLPVKEEAGVSRAILQSDGKVVVGWLKSRGEESVTLARFLPGGEVDRSFGTDGLATVRMRVGEGTLGIAEQKDGKLLLAMSGRRPDSDEDFTVLRFTAAGQLDTGSFGIGGIASVPGAAPNGEDNVNCAAVQEDGGILVAGTTYCESARAFAVARFLPNGSADHEFGRNGLAFTPVSAGTFLGWSVHVSGDGHILLAGTGRGAAGGSFAVARFTRHGHLDPDYGSGGIAVAPMNGKTKAAFGALQPDGKMIVAGRAGATAVVTRFESSGALDRSFANSGTLTLGSNGGSGARAIDVFDVKLQKNGNILLIGSANTGAGFRYAVTKLDESGRLVESFGSGGTAAADVEGRAMSGLLPGDGMVILSGFALLEKSKETGIGLARLRVD